jgi:hypothetical protein
MNNNHITTTSSQLNASSKPTHASMSTNSIATACSPKEPSGRSQDLAGVFLAHRPTQELIAMEDPDFQEVAQVIADGDRLADVGSQGRVAVAQPLETDLVAPNCARLGVHNEQQIEFFEAFWQPRQEAIAAPGVQRRLTDFAMDADVVRAEDVIRDRPVQVAGCL